MKHEVGQKIPYRFKDHTFQNVKSSIFRDVFVACIEKHGNHGKKNLYSIKNDKLTAVDMQQVSTSFFRITKRKQRKIPVYV
jgi:hypothetical protein